MNIYIRSIFPTIGRANGPGGSLYFHFLMSLLIINPVTSPIRTDLMVNQLRIVSSILFLIVYQLCLKERKKNAFYQLRDNCIQTFHLRRYIVGYTVGNLVLRQRVSGAVKRDFRTYIRRYTYPNETFEYGYPNFNVLLTYSLA